MLDLATGTGAVARQAARRRADVVGVDSSPGMLALGRELSPGIEFVVAGAAALPFDDDSFEAVTCGLSLSHFEARGTVFDEVRRVLRPGGCFAASTWGRGGDSAARQVGTLFNRYAPNPPAWLDEDTWSDPVEGRAALRDAGFDDVTVLTEAFAGRFADAEEVLAWSLAWPLRAERLAALDHAARERFLAEARELDYFRYEPREIADAGGAHFAFKVGVFGRFAGSGTELEDEWATVYTLKDGMAYRMVNEYEWENALAALEGRVAGALS